MPDFDIKIAETENEIIEFEKGTYEAFSKRNPDNWLCKNYKLIDGCRYQSPIPYEYQAIYIAKEGNKIIAGASINFNTKIKLQLEDIGFNLDEKIKKEKFCEGLLLFTARNTNISPFLSGIELRNFMKKDIGKRELSFILGTCSEDKKNFYVKFGYEIIDEKINYEGEKKYLMKMDVANIIDPK
jgi:hypothetical protein